MAQVKDITAYPNGLIEVVFEDENGRDVAFFHDYMIQTDETGGQQNDAEQQ